MKTKRRLTVWWKWLRGVPRGPRRTSDFGDHGTAFALDLTLEHAYAHEQATLRTALDKSQQPTASTKV